MTNNDLRVANTLFGKVITDINSDKEAEDFFEELFDVPLGEFAEKVKQDFDELLSDADEEIKNMKVKDFLKIVMLDDINEEDIKE